MSTSADTDLLKILESHPLTASLRKNDPTVILERSVLAIPPKDLADNFTTGTIGLSFGGETIAPAVLASKKTATVIAAYHIGRKLTGHVGYAHGGAIATFFDEVCGRACLVYFQREAEDVAETNGQPKTLSKLAAVTAQLSVSYMAPIAINSTVIVQAVVDVTESKGRKAVSKAKLWTIEDDGSEILAAESAGLFITPKTSDI